MASSAPRGKRLTPGRFFRLVMFAAGLPAILPAAAHAQDLSRRAYLLAESQLTVARNEHDLGRAQMEDALDEVGDARDSGDQGRFQRALAVYQETARELEFLDRLLADQGARFEQARRDHLRNVDDRLEAMFEEFRLLPDESPEYDRIRREIRNLDYEASQLSLPVVINYDPFPEITIDPDDSPAEMRAKAEVLERQVTRAELLLLDIDILIESNERRLRNARMSQDFGADLFRFGDLQVPVGTPDSAPADSVGREGNAELSRRLQDLYRDRERTIERRDIAGDRAAELRQRMGGEPG